MKSQVSIYAEQNLSHPFRFAATHWGGQTLMDTSSRSSRGGDSYMTSHTSPVALPVNTVSLTEFSSIGLREAD